MGRIDLPKWMEAAIGLTQYIRFYLQNLLCYGQVLLFGFPHKLTLQVQMDLLKANLGRNFSGNQYSPQYFSTVILIN